MALGDDSRQSNPVSGRHSRLYANAAQETPLARAKLHRDLPKHVEIHAQRRRLKFPMGMRPKLCPSCARGLLEKPTRFPRTHQELVVSAVCVVKVLIVAYRKIHCSSLVWHVNIGRPPLSAISRHPRPLLFLGSSALSVIRAVRLLHCSWRLRGSASRRHGSHTYG